MKKELIFLMQKLVADLREQAEREKCSSYMQSLVEELQDLLSLC